MAKRTYRAFASLSEIEGRAARKVPADVWSYIEGAAGEGVTHRANHDAFDRWVLRPRIFAGVRTVDLRTRLLEDDARAPVFLAPTAYHGLIHPDAEVGTARAAAKAGLVAMFSTLSSRSVEEVGATRPAGPRWFQLYLQPTWAGTERLVRRAEKAGFTALVLTADVPVLGVRDGQLKTGFAIDGSIPVGSGPGVLPPSRGPEREGASYVVRDARDERWEVVGRLRDTTRLPLVVKGVLTAPDARACVRHGARAVVVSNHGGRQLDRVSSSLAALPEVVAAVGRRAEVYLDGGVRRGSDVLIALALGARAVGVGRPVLWALAAGGERGVERYLSLLETEFASAMVLAGKRSLSEIDRSTVARAAA